MAGAMCPNDQQIDGKIVVITGATSGIGKETALELAKRAGHIILAVRNNELGNNVADEIRKITRAKIDVGIVDLSSLKSVREFAKNLSK